MSVETERPEYVLKGGPFIDSIAGEILEVDFYKDHVRLFSLRGKSDQTLGLPLDLPYSALELGPPIKRKGDLFSKFTLSFKVEPPVSCNVSNFFIEMVAGRMPLYNYVAEKTGDVTHEETQRTIQALRDKATAFNHRMRRIGLALTGIGGTLLVLGLIYTSLFGASPVTGDSINIALVTLFFGPTLVILGLVFLRKSWRLPYYLR